MKSLKMHGVSLTMIFAINIVGCGGDTKQSPEKIIPTKITVERGKVFNANVIDKNGNIAIQNIGTNTYTFLNKPTYPITASGGWIDIDGNNKLTSNDIKLDINLTSYTNEITPISTFISNSDKNLRNQKLLSLLSKINDSNLSSEQLLMLPSKSSIEVQKLHNAAFVALLKNDDKELDIILNELNNKELTQHLQYKEQSIWKHF
jgi:hypothetical protein